MAFSNNQLLTAADLNNLADLTSTQTFTGVQSFNNAGNPKVNVAADLVEQSSAPATPTAGNARLYVNNSNPPLLRLVQDDGDNFIVGGYQWDESTKEWYLYNPETTTFVENRGQIVVDDHFFKVLAPAAGIIYTLQGNWGTATTGVTTFPAAGRRGGGIRVTTAGAANDRFALLAGAVTGGDNGWISRDDNPQMQCVIDAVETTAKVIQFGLATDPTASQNPGTDGIYWEYDSAAQADWVGVVRAGGANTDAASTVNAAAGVIHLAFEVIGGTNVRFFTRTSSSATWTLRGTNVGAQPASGALLVPFIRVETTATASKSLDIYRIKFTASDGIS